jgi:hypothetical protein
MMGYGARESGAGSGVDTWLEEASSIPGVRDIVKPCTAVRLLQEDGSEDAQAASSCASSCQTLRVGPWFVGKLKLEYLAGWKAYLVPSFASQKV